MSKKFVYIGLDGFETEAEAYESVDYVTTGGLANANKPVLLDATGKFDSSLIDFGAIDHGSLAGLTDDDHTQYLLIDGTRSMTGNLQLGANEAFSSSAPSTANSLVNKAYADALAVGNRMKGNVKVATTANITLSGLQTIDGYLTVAGDRVLVKDQTDPTENGIYTADSGAWVRSEDLDNAPLAEILNGVIVPRVLNSASNQETLSFYISSVGSGVDGVHVIGVDAISFEIYTTSTQLSAGAGVNFNGNIVEVDLIDVNSGLYFDGNNDVGIDWASVYTDAKAWKASDLNATKIPIVDAGGYTSEGFIEGAIQELYKLHDENGVRYTVAVGGVTKGDLVYVSANNTISPYTDISVGNRAIGLALATETVGNEITVLANDTVVKGVLSGAVAGTVYYWDGAALTPTIPSAGGQYVWRAGVAKNATDLQVEVEFVKKNN